MTPDLDFTTHVTQLRYKLDTQKREAILLGAKSGVLSRPRALRLWQQYVEPKFAYACAIWVRPDDKSALSLIDSIQSEGAKIMLGISDLNEATTIPPPCALLREAGLQPAHVLHAAGLLRFWRLVLSREPDSLLSRVWGVVNSRGSHMHPQCVNKALHRVTRSVPQIIRPHDLPPPHKKLRWKKEIVNATAHALITAWTREHIAKWGRVAEYSHIATELDQDRPAYRHFPTYLTTAGLKKSERRNIALFRIQATQYVAAHAGFRDTELYGERQNYQRRCCIWTACKSRRVADDTTHVLLHCPLHAAPRERMLQRVRAALLQIGLTLDDMGSEINVVRLLLGSPPRIALGPIGTSATAYRDVLRATAEFIRSVYDSRWIRGHKRNAKA